MQENTGDQVRGCPHARFPSPSLHKANDNRPRSSPPWASIQPFLFLCVTFPLWEHCWLDFPSSFLVEYAFLAPPVFGGPRWVDPVRRAALLFVVNRTSSFARMSWSTPVTTREAGPRYASLAIGGRWLVDLARRPTVDNLVTTEGNTEGWVPKGRVEPTPRCPSALVALNSPAHKDQDQRPRKGSSPGGAPDIRVGAPKE